MSFVPVLLLDELLINKYHSLYKYWWISYAVSLGLCLLQWFILADVVSGAVSIGVSIEIFENSRHSCTLASLGFHLWHWEILLQTWWHLPTMLASRMNPWRSQRPCFLGSFLRDIYKIQRYLLVQFQSAFSALGLGQFTVQYIVQF